MKLFLYFPSLRRAVASSLLVFLLVPREDALKIYNKSSKITDFNDVTGQGCKHFKFLTIVFGVPFCVKKFKEKYILSNCDSKCHKEILPPVHNICYFRVIFLSFLIVIFSKSKQH